jgi:hypothetical protein
MKFVFAVLFLVCARANAESLHVSFNLHDNGYSQFIVEQENVRLWTETGRVEQFRYFQPFVPNNNPYTNYWQGGVVGHVTFGFTFPFYAQTGVVSARTDTFFAIFDPNAFSRLSISIDNVHWNIINGINSDISSIIHDSNIVYVRDELYAEASPMFAQFLRSDITNSTPTFILDVNGGPIPAPEPSSIILMIFALIALAVRVYK